VNHQNPAANITNLATSGFERFTKILQVEADSVEKPPPALGHAYIRFARQHPELFRLMFSSNRLDPQDPYLKAASDKAFAVLAKAVEEKAGEKKSPLAARCLVHGFATPLLDKRLPQTDPHALLATLFPLT